MLTSRCLLQIPHLYIKLRTICLYEEFNSGSVESVALAVFRREGCRYNFDVQVAKL